MKMAAKCTYRQCQEPFMPFIIIVSVAESETTAAVPPPAETTRLPGTYITLI